jgi:hypothetical protein
MFVCVSIVCLSIFVFKSVSMDVVGLFNLEPLVRFTVSMHAIPGAFMLDGGHCARSNHARV